MLAPSSSFWMRGRRCSLLDQARSVAGQFAQLALGAVRHEAAPNQPMPQQLGDPLAILDVGLAAWHRLDVLSVGQDQREAVLQQVVDGLPVHAGRFHGHMGDSSLSQPLAQRFDGRRCRLKRAHFAFDLAVHAANDATGHDESLVNIEPRRAGINHLHRALPVSATGQGLHYYKTVLYVLRAWRATRCGACGDPGHSLRRARDTNTNPTSLPG